MSDFEKNIRALSRNIQMLRVKHDLSQEQLAAKAGLDRTYVGGIERGERNPTLSTIARLADALNTSVVALLTFQSHDNLPE